MIFVFSSSSVTDSGGTQTLSVTNLGKRKYLCVKSGEIGVVSYDLGREGVNEEHVCPCMISHFVEVQWSTFLFLNQIYNFEVALLADPVTCCYR